MNGVLLKFSVINNNKKLIKKKEIEIRKGFEFLNAIMIIISASEYQKVMDF